MRGSEAAGEHWTEAIRAAYRPPVIRVLFVGDSAPLSGRHFYLGNSSVFREFRRVLGPVIGSKTGFLDDFRDSGLYLDELVLCPVKGLSKAERERARAEAVPDLAGRMAGYRPRMVICFLKGIGDLVGAAVQESGLTVPYHVVAFPGNGQQARFRRELAELLPEIARLATKGGG